MKRGLLVICAASIGCSDMGSCGRSASLEWVRLQEQPIERFARYEPRIGAPAFESETRCGRFRLLERPGGALLLTEKGDPLWAGTWALPIRSMGTERSLLLLRAMNATWHECTIYDIAFFDFASDPPWWWRIGQGRFVVDSSSGKSDQLQDCDGDGNDELVLFTLGPEGIDSLIQVRWYLSVVDFSWDPGGPPRGGRLDDMDPQGSLGSGREGRKGEVRGGNNKERLAAVAPVVSIRERPIDAAPMCLVSVEKGPGRYRLVQYDWDSRPVRVLGEIVRDPKTGEFVYSSSTSATGASGNGER